MDQPVILVVEDDDSLREIVAETLRDSGYDVLEASGGAAALEIARAARPALVLCDISMPGLDGWGVLRALRADPETATLPLVFLTGDGLPERQRDGMALGADDFLVKPVRSTELIRTVEARLARRTAAAGELQRRMDGLRLDIATALPHELRTPLTTVLGASALLDTLHGALEPEERLELVRSIHAAGRRLERLLEVFGLYAALASGLEPAVHPDTPTGPDVITDAATAAARRHGRDVDLTIELAKAGMAAGAEHVGRLVRELVDNACRFSPAGSPVHVRSHTEGGRLVLEIEDHGSGIAADELERMGAFAQPGRAWREQQGSGLGLAVARGLCGLYGGSLSVRSSGGTVVRTDWPAA